MAFDRTRAFSFLVGFLGLLFRLFGLKPLWGISRRSLGWGLLCRLGQALRLVPWAYVGCSLHN